MNKSKTSIAKFEDYFCKENRDIVLEAIDNDKEYISIDFSDLKKLNQELANLLLDKPEEVLKAAETALENTIKQNKQLKVLIENIPPTHSLNDLRSSRDVGRLISVDAYIVEAKEISHRLNRATFECRSCMRLYELNQTGNLVSEPALCQECGGRSFRLLQEESEFIEQQVFKLEGTKLDESRQFSGVLAGPLVEYGKFKKGMNVNVIAIPTVYRNDKKTSFEIYLKINNISITDEQKVDLGLKITNEPPYESNIYFIFDGEFVKIGKADDPQKRLAGLQTGSAKHLNLLYTMKGDETLESFLHQLFAEYRKKGEWFRCEGLLKEFIERGYAIVPIGNPVNNESQDKSIELYSDEDKKLVLDFLKSIELDLDNYSNAVNRFVIIDEMAQKHGFSENKTIQLLDKLVNSGQIYRPGNNVYRPILSLEEKLKREKQIKEKEEQRHQEYIKSDRYKFRLVLELIKELSKDYGGHAPLNLIIKEMKDRHEIDEEKTSEIILVFKRQAIVYEPIKGHYKVS